MKSAAQPLFKPLAFFDQSLGRSDSHSLKPEFQRLCLNSAGPLLRIARDVLLSNDIKLDKYSNSTGGEALRMIRGSAAIKKRASFETAEV